MVPIPVEKLNNYGLSDVRDRIFILEGLLTVFISLFAKIWVPDWPETAALLGDDERRLLLARLASDTGNARMDTLDRNSRRRIFKDWKVYVGTLAYLGVVTTGYSGSVSKAFHSHTLTPTTDRLGSSSRRSSSRWDTKWKRPKPVPSPSTSWLR